MSYNSKIDLFEDHDNLVEEPLPGASIALWPLPFNDGSHQDKARSTQLIVAPKRALPVLIAHNYKSPEVKEPWQLSPKTVAQTLVIVWLVTCLLIAGINIGSFAMSLKGLGIALVCFLARPKGFTHILVDKCGITLSTKSGVSELNSKSLLWNQIASIKLEPAKNQNLLDAKLCITAMGSVYRLKMSKFAESARWKAFVYAVRSFSDLGANLNGNFLDPLSLQVDESFTRLWLDSLAAPPRRERLQPLVAGATLQNGRFSVLKKIGTGGQGNAYLASSEELGTVVLKEFVLPLYVEVSVRKQAISQFERESKLLASLDHQGIIRVFDTFVEDQRAYLVLECANGTSLKENVQANGAMGEEQVASLGVELCGILSYLHGQSPPLVHQDFTPDNLIKTNSGIKLIDFSGTRALDGHTTAVIGKRSYMPPEQFRGNPTTQSDIFALGCTLAYLLTAIDPEPISQAHPKNLNSSISTRLNAIIEKATAINCEQRYQTADSMAADLQALCLAQKEQTRSLNV